MTTSTHVVEPLHLNDADVAAMQPDPKPTTITLEAVFVKRRRETSFTFNRNNLATISDDSPPTDPEAKRHTVGYSSFSDRELYALTYALISRLLSHSSIKLDGSTTKDIMSGCYEMFCDMKVRPISF